MNENLNTIHRSLDKELSPEEQTELAERVRTDDGFRRDHEELTLSVRMLESSGRLEPPPGFTASVLRRLPAPAPSLARRLWLVLFGRRVLHWNAATGVAVAAALLVGGAFLAQLRPWGDATAPGMTVRFTLHAPQARTVAVAGSFNKWSAGADVLRRDDGGRWTIDLPLKPGVYAYMFVIDGAAWIPDPQAVSFQSDGFGGRNAVVKVAI